MPHRGQRGRRGVAVRRPLVALATAAIVVLVALWLPGRAASQGVGPAPAASCPPSPARVTYPARPGRDRLLLPVAYRAAPVGTLWCRYRPNGSLAASSRLDAARTSRLVAVLVAPPGGWPDDALAAKTTKALTDAQLGELAAPACDTPSVADLLVFDYAEGPDAAVLLRREPCGDARNGVLRLRIPPGIVEALANLARADGSLRG